MKREVILLISVYFKLHHLVVAHVKKPFQQHKIHGNVYLGVTSQSSGSVFQNLDRPTICSRDEDSILGYFVCENQS